MGKKCFQICFSYTPGQFYKHEKPSCRVRKQRSELLIRNVILMYILEAFIPHNVA